MTVRYILVLGILHFLMVDSLSQTDSTKGSFLFASVKYHRGKHLYTGQQLTDKLKNGYNAVEARFGWQTTGKHGWEGQYNYPSFGIGFYTGFIGDVDIFGRPHALFGFATFPFGKSRRTNFQIEPALGLTFNLKPYNPVTNEIKDAIGARFAAYISMHIGGKTKLNREIDLLYGMDLTHFSNGRMVTPNLGLNMLGFSIGCRYNFNSAQGKVDASIYPKTILPARPTTRQREKARRSIENNVSIYQAIGTVQNKDDAGTGHRYLTSSTILEYQHKFNTKHGISLGVDALIDPSARDTAEHKANKDAMAIFFPAAHAGYDFMFWRLTIKLQVGVHLTSVGRELKGTTFVRPAIRYEINKRLFAQVGLKTMNGATADWIECGIGFKVFYKSNDGGGGSPEN